MEDNVTRRTLVELITGGASPFARGPEPDRARHASAINGMIDAGADDSAIEAYLASQGMTAAQWRGEPPAPWSPRDTRSAGFSVAQAAWAPDPEPPPSRPAVAPSPAWPDPPSYGDAAEAAKARQNWARTLSRPYANRAAPQAGSEAVAAARPDYLESSALWPVAPLPTGPGREPMMGGIYAAPVRRAPRWDTVVTTATPWSVRSPLPSATSWGEPDPGIECYVSDGQLHCTTPGGRQFMVPAEHFPEGLRIAPGEPNYHYYSKPDRPVPLDQSMLMQGVVSNPTVGIRRLVNPATPQGTSNDATPRNYYYGLLGAANNALDIPGRAPLPLGTSVAAVTSYLTTDQTGAPIVVNVTKPGHPLYPGIVVRYVTTSPSGATIQNEGTGLGPRQAPGSRLADQINSVWEGHADEIVRGLRHNRAGSSGW